MKTLQTIPRFIFMTLAAALFSTGAFAQAIEKNIDVKAAWVRATVAGQKATGAFMTLTTKQNLRLVSISSPAAGVAEVHEMRMDGDVMKMRALPGLDLPAGKAVELKPGSYHVMLMDLNAPMTVGSTVPLSLLFKNAKGVSSKLDISAPVSLSAPGSTGKMAEKMDGEMKMHKH